MSPTATTRPARIPTSARTPALPVPSTTVPPLSRTSSISTPPRIGDLPWFAVSVSDDRQMHRVDGPIMAHGVIAHPRGRRRAGSRRRRGHRPLRLREPVVPGGPRGLRRLPEPRGPAQRGRGRSPSRPTSSGNLRNRLRVVDWRATHPEVAAGGGRWRRCSSIGLPRTGTTLLSALLAEDPRPAGAAPLGVGRPRPPARDGDLRTPTRASRRPGSRRRDARPAQPRVQGHPPRAGRGPDRVRHPPRSALHLVALGDRRQRARRTASGCSPPTSTTRTPTTTTRSSCSSRARRAGGR